jgi:alcohol dehydrogenase YqhD (iron-dependent ADH family)
MSNYVSYGYYLPTRIIAGKDCIIQNRDLFRSLGKKALIVTGAHSAKRNGSLSDVITALEATGVSYFVFDKVMSNRQSPGFMREPR